MNTMYLGMNAAALKVDLKNLKRWNNNYKYFGFDAEESSGLLEIS